MVTERQRRFLTEMLPWIGLLVAAAALSIGLQAIAAGYAGRSLVGYLAGGLCLAAGFVTARRAWTRRLDRVLAGGIVVVVVLSVFVLVRFEPPATVFEQLTG